jgi:hypothetical protein
VDCIFSFDNSKKSSLFPIEKINEQISKKD